MRGREGFCVVCLSHVEKIQRSDWFVFVMLGKCRVLIGFFCHLKRSDLAVLKDSSVFLLCCQLCNSL